MKINKTYKSKQSSKLSQLEAGDFFEYNDCLHILLEENTFECMNFSIGTYIQYCGDLDVFIVWHDDIEITYDI